MPATITLSTITLAQAVDKQEARWTLSSLTGLAKGTRLYVGQELVAIEQPSTPVSQVVVVKRGVDGTISSPHPAGATVYVGTGDQFYLTDPAGTPPNPILVSPYINVITGTVWGVTGDDSGPGAAARVWAPVTNVPAVGAFGVRTTTTTSPS